MDLKIQGVFRMSLLRQIRSLSDASRDRPQPLNKLWSRVNTIISYRLSSRNEGFNCKGLTIRGHEYGAVAGGAQYAASLVLVPS
jgi:hypothetical protein